MFDKIKLELSTDGLLTGLLMGIGSANIVLGGSALVVTGNPLSAIPIGVGAWSVFFGIYSAIWKIEKSHDNIVENQMIIDKKLDNILSQQELDSIGIEHIWHKMTHKKRDKKID